MTVPEKRYLVAKKKKKKIKIFMLVTRFNPPLCCVKILKDKTLYAQRDDWPKLPYSNREVEVKNKKTLIEVQLLVSLIFLYT